MGFQAKLAKGTKLTINSGLAITLDEDLDFTIDDADDADEAAVLCHIKNVPCDLSHFDGEKGVNVTYTTFSAERIETKPEEVAVEAPAKAAKTTKAKK